MSAKIVFIVGTLGVLGYAGHTMADHDPSVVPYAREHVVNLLEDARTVLPRRDGPGEIEVWSSGRTERGVSLKFRYANDAPISGCEAVVEALAPNESRVTAQCGSNHAGSAQGKTLKRMRTA